MDRCIARVKPQGLAQQIAGLLECRPFQSEDQLARLHGPIGLDIGAQSPEEIGVAVLAQMIAAKSAKLAPAERPMAAATA